MTSPPVPAWGSEEYRWWAAGAQAEVEARRVKDRDVQEAIALLEALDTAGMSDPMGSFRRIMFPTRWERIVHAVGWRTRRRLRWLDRRR